MGNSLFPAYLQYRPINAWVNWRHREAWKQIQKRAMEKDFSWLHSAKEYEKLFKLALKFRAKA